MGALSFCFLLARVLQIAQQLPVVRFSLPLSLPIVESSSSHLARNTSSLVRRARRFLPSASLASASASTSGAALASASPPSASSATFS